MGDAGARRGMTPLPTSSADIPAARHTFADALTRPFPGYAMPEGGAPAGTLLLSAEAGPGVASRAGPRNG